MGTRSLTVFEDERGDEIVVMYRQLDGYPEGHGAELAEFLSPIVMVNGISGDAKAGTHANGMGCLTAQAIAEFKNGHGIGGIYVHPAGTRECGEEYRYHVRGKEGKQPEIMCVEVGFGEHKDKKLWPYQPSSKVMSRLAKAAQND